MLWYLIPVYVQVILILREQKLSVITVASVICVSLWFENLVLDLVKTRHVKIKIDGNVSILNALKATLHSAPSCNSAINRSCSLKKIELRVKLENSNSSHANVSTRLFYTVCIHEYVCTTQINSIERKSITIKFTGALTHFIFISWNKCSAQTQSLIRLRGPNRIVE